MFIPLAHPAGHGQADFGEAVVVLGGVEQKVHFFAFDLPQSDACYIRAYHTATFMPLASLARCHCRWCMTTTAVWLRRSRRMAVAVGRGCLHRCCRTTYLVIVMAAQTRGMIKAMLKVWSVGCDAL